MIYALLILIALGYVLLFSLIAINPPDESEELDEAREDRP